MIRDKFVNLSEAKTLADSLLHKEGVAVAVYRAADESFLVLDADGYRTEAHAAPLAPQFVYDPERRQDVRAPCCIPVSHNPAGHA